MAKAKRGRKPKGEFGGKLSNFSTRIQPETRKALEREAEAARLSISQLAERLLVAGLAKRRDNERDKAMRALCFVLAETAHQVVGPHVLNEETRAEAPMFNWRSHPFFYRAFKYAVVQILDALEPRGEIKAPEIGMNLNPTYAKQDDDYSAARRRYLDSFKTPEARADYTADNILNSLMRVPRQSMEERDEERRRLEMIGVPSFLREFYGMADASKALEADPGAGHSRQPGLLVSV
jgi:hypothetical protein